MKSKLFQLSLATALTVLVFVAGVPVQAEDVNKEQTKSFTDVPKSTITTGKMYDGGTFVIFYSYEKGAFGLPGDRWWN